VAIQSNKAALGKSKDPRRETSILPPPICNETES